MKKAQALNENDIEKVSGGRRNLIPKRPNRKKEADSKKPAPSLLICPNCGKEKLPHRICPNCGYADGI